MKFSAKKLFSAPLIICAISISVAFLSCSEFYGWSFYRSNSIYERVSQLTQLNDDTTLELTNTLSQKGKYTALIISDMHFGRDAKHHTSEEAVNTFYSWLEKQIEASTVPDFCICLGDMTDHGKESEYNAYLEMCRKINNYGIKHIYNVTGNHDLFNNGWKYYSTLMYPKETSFYHFATHGFSYYFLDTGSASLGQIQMTHLTNAFKSDPLPKIICMHYPAYADGNINVSYYSFTDTKEIDRLLKLCANNNVSLILEGHTHKYYKNDFGKFTEFNVPSLLDQKQWAIVTVDETNGIAEAKLITP